MCTGLIARNKTIHVDTFDYNLIFAARHMQCACIARYMLRSGVCHAPILHRNFYTAEGIDLEYILQRYSRLIVRSTRKEFECLRKYGYAYLPLGLCPKLLPFYTLHFSQPAYSLKWSIGSTLYNKPTANRTNGV